MGVNDQKNWRIKIGEKIIGPCWFADLVAMRNEGELPDSVLISREGTEWVQACRLDFFVAEAKVLRSAKAGSSDPKPAPRELKVWSVVIDGNQSVQCTHSDLLFLRSTGWFNDGLHAVDLRGNRINASDLPRPNELDFDHSCLIDEKDWFSFEHRWKVVALGGFLVIAVGYYFTRAWWLFGSAIIPWIIACCTFTPSYDSKKSFGEQFRFAVTTCVIVSFLMAFLAGLGDEGAKQVSEFGLTFEQFSSFAVWLFLTSISGASLGIFAAEQRRQWHRLAPLREVNLALRAWQKAQPR